MREDTGLGLYLLFRALEFLPDVVLFSLEAPRAALSEALCMGVLAILLFQLMPMSWVLSLGAGVFFSAGSMAFSRVVSHWFSVDKRKRLHRQMAKLGGVMSALLGAVVLGWFLSSVPTGSLLAGLSMDGVETFLVVAGVMLCSLLVVTLVPAAMVSWREWVGQVRHFDVDGNDGGGPIPAGQVEHGGLRPDAKDNGPEWGQGGVRGGELPGQVGAAAPVPAPAPKAAQLFASPVVPPAQLDSNEGPADGQGDGVAARASAFRECSLRGAVGSPLAGWFPFSGRQGCAPPSQVPVGIPVEGMAGESVTVYPV